MMECCESKAHHHSPNLRTIAIVGNPNVGKSVLFNNLTGRYMTVANYPGTTVQVARGQARIGTVDYEVVDTPGMYSFSSITEEEKVARNILIRENPYLVIHLVDAKNLERMLAFTLQLLEAELPTILVLNMMDETRRAGVQIDIPKLEQELKIPVVGTVSTTGEGMKELLHRIETYGGKEHHYRIPIGGPIEAALNKSEDLLNDSYLVAKRLIGLLALEEDRDVLDLIKQKQPEILFRLEELRDEIASHAVSPVEYEIAMQLKKEADRVAGQVMKTSNGGDGFKEKLSGFMMNPLTGLPILFVVLYFGLYKFVGEFGAGTVVDFIEGSVFERYLNPWFTRVVTSVVPWAVLQSLFVGEYGLITLGVRYAVALILPIVTFFFIVFSIIEDSGYLPRLAMLIDRVFKKIGLSGRAVIPMVLGFGCDTMATMVTRTLPTTRERLISTLLLALAIPCSAQLGVILALLHGRPLATFIWAGVVSMVFLFVGYLAAQIIPGEKPSFYMELPPLRWPKVSNVLIKTYVRVKWYFYEVLPLFLLASVFIWLGQLSGVFDLTVNLLKRPVMLIGMPPEAAKVFLFGFFRRDYGAAGLYDLTKAGLLNGTQIVVACVALTLFLPCIAQFLMNVKERGWKTGVWISFFILFFSFGVAFVLNFALTHLGVVL
ncbi:MAG: ferrous iron transport protein B [Omnitrophica bacterium RIFCSPLOWO2_01_FULL_50_24]|nr:MAG: ferrous iron transport protein B [Omnitrophica bacterium RIFCSPLOWO2_01_FULL_50_24]